MSHMIKQQNNKYIYNTLIQTGYITSVTRNVDYKVVYTLTLVVMLKLPRL